MVTENDRATAGANYAEALEDFIDAFVELRAIETLLGSPGSFSSDATDTGALIPFRHQQFAPKLDEPRLADRVRARVAELA